LKPARDVTLHWPGKTTPPTHGDPGGTHDQWTTPDGSALIQGDNLAVLKSLARQAPATATLAYLDPPFFTNQVHSKKDRTTGKERVAFDDRWADRAAYLEALGARLSVLRELLAPHGSIIIHVDPKTSHYVKVMADEIFGDDAFASEIVWRYRRWPSRTPNFQRVHDVLLRYRKDPAVAPRWNPLYEPLAASTLATWGTNKQRAVFEEGGRRARSSSTSEPTVGAPMGDVWEIGVLAPVARERTGYPSQKPEALLERIVAALSDPDDLVVDAYAGSGTTLAVASRLGRRFLGVDQSDVAIETCLARLAEQGVTLTRRENGARPVTNRGAPCAKPRTPLTVARARGSRLKRAEPRQAPALVSSRLR